MYAVSASHWALNMAIAIRWVRVGKVFIATSEALVLIYVPMVNVRCSLMI
jgi:hypothetical protein